MFVLMLKVVNNCLSEDDRLRRVGVVKVSNCDCCTQGYYEDCMKIMLSILGSALS